MNDFKIFGELTDFAFQWINLIFLIIPIAKAAIDVFLFEKKSKPVNHTKHLAYSMAVGLLFSFIDWQVSEVQYLFQSILLGIGYHFVFFDYVRNLFAGKHILYIDYGNDDKIEDSSWDTKLYAKIGPINTLFLKFCVAIIAMGTYYILSLVTS